MTEQAKSNTMSSVQDSQDHRENQSDQTHTGEVSVNVDQSNNRYPDDHSTVFYNNNQNDPSTNESAESHITQNNNLSVSDKNDDNNANDNSVQFQPLDGNVIRETMRNMSVHGYRDDINLSVNSDDNSDSSDSDSSSTVSEENDDSDNTSLRYIDVII